MTQPLRTLPTSRSAAIGGIGAIVVTGTFAVLAAAAVLLLAAGYGFRMETIDWALLGLVLALTIGGGVALARFVRHNPGAVGEARFDTTGDG
jgi:succinate dehydrogenase/fumarate reductase flavoprotein subunit